jgi:hypothetical protein
MARYIDADVFVECLKQMYCKNCNNYHGVRCKGCNIDDVIDFIEDAPTADVVDVVRCKDCIYKTVTKDGEYNPEDIVCEYHMSDGFDSDDYCSYGKRKKVE